MSYLVLARKYRPQTFDDVVGQPHVVTTLANSITAGRVAHALCFSGPRGTGKTTVARLLAKALNCVQGPTVTPCNTCISCCEITSGNAVDVFEIDGASNNGVEHIRNLRENVKYAPAHSPYRIYIIDEVHMLSSGAFNALLKTLEEPPGHVVFMLATTEPHKIPVTILSRCQRHEFRRIGLDTITGRMKEICDREGFCAPEEGLWIIAKESAGSMRDALSLLDQVMAYADRGVTTEQVQEILGVADRRLLYVLTEAVLRRDVAACLECIEELYDRGHDLKKLSADLVEQFRNLVVVKAGLRPERLVDVPAHELEGLGKLVQDLEASFLEQIFQVLFQEDVSVKLSSHPRLALEVALIRLCRIPPSLTIEKLIQGVDGLLAAPGRTPALQVPSRQMRHGMVTEPPAPCGLPRNVAETGPGTRDEKTSKESTGNPNELWQHLIETVGVRQPLLAANLEQCRLKSVGEGIVEIEASGNGLHRTILNNPKYLESLRAVCSAFFNRDTRVEIASPPQEEKADSQHAQMDQMERTRRLRNEALNHPLVTEAVEVFDGKVVDVKVL